jgi:hypothetical protein
MNSSTCGHSYVTLILSECNFKLHWCNNAPLLLMSKKASPRGYTSNMLLVKCKNLLCPVDWSWHFAVIYSQQILQHVSSILLIAIPYLHPFSLKMPPYQTISTIHVLPINSELIKWQHWGQASANQHPGYCCTWTTEHFWTPPPPLNCCKISVNW